MTMLWIDRPLVVKWCSVVSHTIKIRIGRRRFGSEMVSDFRCQSADVPTQSSYLLSQRNMSFPTFI